MKNLKRLNLAAAALVLAAGALMMAGCNRLSPDEQVRKLAEDFVNTSLALSPSTATSMGYHQHQGVVLDELLDDLSDQAIAGQRVFYNEAHANADRMAQMQLTPDARADLTIIKQQAELGLLELDTLQSFKHNPTVYVESLGNALYSPFIQNYAPQQTRLTQITARLEKIPAFLEIAKRNLLDAPAIWNEVAKQENDGNVHLIEQTIQPKVPQSLRPRFDKAAKDAVGALKGFNLFLKDVLSKRPSDWRIGKQKYDAKFRLTLATAETPDQTLARARQSMRQIREDMKSESLAIYSKLFPGKTPPTDLNQLVSQVLATIALQHATPDSYFAEAKSDLTEATDFVRSHRLLELPKRSNLQVIATPEFMRGIFGVGGFSPAPPFEPQLGAFYWITPFTPDMSPERIESKLREYNTYGLKILTIHEAMPGHYVQFEYANDVQPKWRGLLRTVFSNDPYVEGWAVYATQLLIDSGYQKTPEMQLTFGKQMLRVVANTILDIELQTGRMTDQQAMDLMTKDTFQEQEEAEKKLQRAKLSSCQLPTYYAGWQGWNRIREAEHSREGSKFQLARFHERALNTGAVPLPLLEELLAHK